MRLSKSTKMAADYVNCTVCRRHHDEGRKHIYHKGHKEKLKTVMKKFTEKVGVVRESLARPDVVRGELVDRGGTTWCYACQREVVSHHSNGETTVTWRGMVEHLKNPAHHASVRSFLWQHGAGQELWEGLVLRDEEYRQYMDRVDGLVSQLLVDKMADEERQLAEIVAKETHQRAVAMDRSNPHQPITSCQRSEQPANQPLRKRRQLNVHEGGIPPWLQDEAPSIGPSEQDFIKHKSMLERSKMSSKRVGANFHQAVAKETGEDWLPSFGSVWNAGPRSQSRIDFKKKMRAGTSKPSAPHQPSLTSHQPSLTSHQPTFMSHQPSLTSHQPPSASHQPTFMSHQPSLTSHQPTFMSHQPSLTSHQPTFMSHQPSLTSHQPPSASHQPTFMSHQPSLTSHQPPSASHQPTFMSHQPSLTSHQPPSASHQPTLMSHQPSLTSHQPPSASHQPTFMSHQPSLTSHQPTSMSHQAQRTNQASPSREVNQVLSVVVKPYTRRRRCV